MTRFSRLVVPLLVAALAAFAVASAQGAKPPAPPGKGPKLTITPSSAVLGPVAPGVGASQEFAVGFKDGTTSGGLRVTVDGVGFAITADTCTGIALNPSRTCAVTVAYRPSGYGENVQGVLTASGKKDVRPVSAHLFGSSTAASLVSATEEIHFGEREIGGSYMPLAIDFTNNATETLSLAGMDAPDGFSPTSSAWMMCEELAPGASCFGFIGFHPTAAGYHEGWFTTTWVNGANETVATTDTYLTGTGIAAGNQAPSGEDFSVNAFLDTPITITLSGYDPDADALTFALVADSGPTHGTLGAITNTSCDGGECSAQVTYSPDEAFFGGDSFSYTLNDGQLDAAAITVSITVASTGFNLVPEVPYGLWFHTNVSTTFLLTGTDQDGDTLTFEITEQPSHGTFGPVGAATCSGTPWTCTAPVTYTPNSGYVGPDSFRFRAYDGTAYSDPAIGVPTKVTVNPPVSGDEPWADPLSRSYNQDYTTAFTLTGGDPNGDSITFHIVTTVSTGVLTDPASVSCSGSPSVCTATVTYTPPPGFTGAVSFTFRTFDGVNYSTPQTVSLTVS